MIHVNSLSDFTAKLPSDTTAWLLLYKKGAESSDCAFGHLEAAVKNRSELPVFAADVSQVRDIHTAFNITTAPVLLSFENKNFVSTYKGCNSAEFFEAVFEKSVFSASSKSDDKPKQKSVTVYSTPTCSWCTRLKSYLNDKGIKYSEIDVSKDSKAAEAMVKKSGQQGVPQTTIGSEHIVGFDKARIDKLLNI